MIKWFIDDERFPADNTGNWVILRSSKEAIDKVITSGMPDFISFDHDLGGNDTSMIFINWLIEQSLDGRIKWPVNFNYTIHSQNPIGAKNIDVKFSNFLINYKVW